MTLEQSANQRILELERELRQARADAEQWKKQYTHEWGARKLAERERDDARAENAILRGALSEVNELRRCSGKRDCRHCLTRASLEPAPVGSAK
jgi:CRISPR/Cas system-associated protein Cas10 (large subunit of type III CRISPR-Cas system)